MRWTGLLAAVVSAVLLGVLARRTEVTELEGTVTSVPVEFLNEAQLVGQNPGRGLFYVMNRGLPGQTGGDLKKVSSAGIASTVFEDAQDKAVRTWMVFPPAEVTRSTQVDDEVVIAVRKLTVLDDGESHLRLVQYRFRRGTTTWTAGEPDNWKFLLTYGVAGGGPILLWAIGAGVALLCGLSRKSATRD